MLLSRFCRIMGFDVRTEDLLKPCWKDLLESFAGVPEYMTSAFAERYLDWVTADADVLPAIRRVAAITAGSPAGQLYARLIFRRHFVLADRAGAEKLPFPEKLYGDDAGVFMLMVAMGAIPMIEATMARMNIPHRYARAIPAWLGGAIGIYRSGHGGRPGFNLSQMFWIRLYIEGRLFRIGRFEYTLHPQPEWSPAVFRRRSDGKLAVLCRDGWKLDADGLRAADDDPADRIAATARLEFGGGRVSGVPISPYGMALPDRRLSLRLDEWEPLVTPWELVPCVHIPGGGGMTLEAAQASLREAVEFFRTYLHQEIRLFVCGSWIFNTAWERELPESNLTRFMRQLYLTPCWPPSGRDGLFFIFGRETLPYDDYPADNSVRRAFHRLRERGERLRSGGMLLPVDGIEHLGEAYYRTGWTLPE